MNPIYLLSGLGADNRVFSYLDLSNYNTIPVVWEDPEKKEPIEKYAARLIQQITAANPILMGVSFGGILAIEIAKLINTKKIILISSAKDATQIPNVSKFISYTNVLGILPDGLLKQPNPVLYEMFGTESDSDKHLLAAILKDTDVKFLRWGMNRIGQWKNTQRFENLIQIHGSADKIFPHQQGDYTIEDGGHFMIVNRAHQISPLLHQILE